MTKAQATTTLVLLLFLVILNAIVTVCVVSDWSRTSPIENWDYGFVEDNGVLLNIRIGDAEEKGWSLFSIVPVSKTSTGDQVMIAVMRRPHRPGGELP